MSPRSRRTSGPAVDDSPGQAPTALPDAHRLGLLLEVQRHGSITAAARAVGVTASAVSQQLSVLERESGVRLVERGRRGVALTGAGLALAEHALTVRHELEAARSTLDQLSGEISGRLRAASIASAATAVVLPALEQIRRTAPGVDVSVSVGEPARSIEGVVDGSLDVAVIDVYDHVPLPLPDHLEATEILREDLVLVTARSAASPDGVALADLRAASWVMPPREAACGQAVRYACRAAGFEPRIRWETDDLLLLVEAVARGEGITVLPRLAVREGVAPVAVVPLAHPSLQRTIFTLARSASARRPVVRTVLDQLARSARRGDEVGTSTRS